MKPLFHDITGKAVGNFLQQPAHAVLLYGEEGAGKGSVAAYMAATLLGTSPEKLTNHPHVAWLHDQTTTSIEDVRAIQKLMQLRVPGRQTIRRVVIIEQAQTMSQEAQNAFLKLLEEPPADTLIILTVTNRTQLLPTILSRLQHIRVLAIPQTTLQQYYAGQFTDTAIQRAFYLSGGHIGLAQAILQDDQSHPLVEQIAQAKTILAGTRFSRLARVDELTKQKAVAQFLQALQRVCHAGLLAAIQKNSPAVAQWKQRLQTVVDAQGLLPSNPQAKLLLTDLFLNL